MHRQIVFEDKVLSELASGSFEEIMSAVHDAVDKDKKTFCGNAALFATYPNNAIVVNESGEFFNVKYSVAPNGKIRFLRTESMDVQAVSLEGAGGQIVEDFFNGNSLSDGLRGLVKASLTESVSPMSQTKQSLRALETDSMYWRQYIADNPEKMAMFAFNPQYGSPKIEVESLFAELYADDSDVSLEEHRGNVLTALTKIENRLHELNHAATESYESYAGITGTERSVEDDEVLSHFEAFAESYLEHLGELEGYVSDVIGKGKDECVACLGLIHDTIAEQARDLELGSRLIRRVSSEFTQNV